MTKARVEGRLLAKQLEGRMTNGLLSALSSYEFEIRRSKDCQFFWVFHNKHGNVEAICQSETYTTLQSCQNSIDLVRGNAADAGVKEAPGVRGIIGGSDLL